jgi:hypothetical protein
LPAAFVLAAWANSWLTGAVSLDDVLDALRRQSAGADLGVAHHVYAADPAALAALDTADAAPLTTSLGRLRSVGTTSFTLALPVPGDPLGLGGPRGFTEAATEAGEAVLCDGTGLGAVPFAVGAGVQWAVSEAFVGSTENLAEADERLAHVIVNARRQLGDGSSHAGRDGGAAWSPHQGHRDRAAAATMGSVRRATAATAAALPPNAPVRADRVLTRSVTCLQIGRFAAERAAEGDDVAPVALVRDLSAAARRGLVAVAQACRSSSGVDR